MNESLSRKSSSEANDAIFLMPDDNPKPEDLTTKSANNTPRLKVKNPCHTIIINDDTEIL